MNTQYYPERAKHKKRTQKINLIFGSILMLAILVSIVHHVSVIKADGFLVDPLESQPSEPLSQELTASVPTITAGILENLIVLMPLIEALGIIFSTGGIIFNTYLSWKKDKRSQSDYEKLLAAQKEQASVIILDPSTQNSQ